MVLAVALWILAVGLRLIGLTASFHWPRSTGEGLELPDLEIKLIFRSGGAKVKIPWAMWRAVHDTQCTS